MFKLNYLLLSLLKKKVFLAPMAMLFFLSNGYAQAFEVNEATKNRIEALIDDFDDLYTTEPTRAKGLIQQALVISKKYQMPVKKAESYYRLGKWFLNVGESDSALHYVNNALKIFSRFNQFENMSLCYKELGTIHDEIGQREESMNYYTEGLKLARQHGLEDQIAPFINNIGIIFLKQSHYDKALDHFKESAQLSKKGYQYAITLNNMGVVKYQQNQFNEAVIYYEKSLKACNDIADEYCSLTPLNGLANISLQEKKYSKALSTTREIIEIQEKLGLEKDLLVSFNRMGLIYNAMSNFEMAIEYYMKSLIIAEKISSVHTPYIHSNISDCYRNIGNYKKALEHMEIFYQKYDSINSGEYKIKTEELLTQYETEKKEKEIALLKKDKKLREIELEKNKALYEQELLNQSLAEQRNKYELLERDRKIDLLNKDSELQKANIINQKNELDRLSSIRNITITSAILILIPIVILLIVYRQKVKNKEMLALKTEEVNRQKSLEMIRSFEIKTIRAHIEGQEIEKKRIAKELHDGVAGSLAAIKMRLQAFGETLNGEPKFSNLLMSVDNVYKEVRTISHNLTPPGMLKHSFVDFLKKYLNEISQAGHFDIEYLFHGEAGLNEITDELKVEIYRILQELITNVVKHAQTNFVEVQLIKDKNHINLIVEDHGKGFDLSEKSYGLGLSNLQSRIKTLGGRLEIDSFKERGTIVSIEIELKEKDVVFS
ncbi:tetratricopeptide repeat protein [Marivirga lumbricoides]